MKESILAKQEEVKLVQQNCYELVCHDLVQSILENKASKRVQKRR